jgi:broad specificity phosphatase PhoE
MRATEILILRHGQSEGNALGRFGGQGPTPLTDKGRAQAEATARALAREGGLTAIFASDLVRAVQTAEPIARATGLALTPTPALRERSVGVFTGLTFAEAERRFPEHYAAMMARTSDACPPEGETATECSHRAVKLVEETIAGLESGRALFVSHAFAINLLLLHLCGMAHATHGRRVFFRTDNCGLHRLRRSEEGLWTIHALNDRAHLVELPR